MRFFLKLVFIMNHTHKNPPCKRKMQSSRPLQTQWRQRKYLRGGIPEFDRGTVKFCVCPLELHDLDKLDNGFICQSSHFNNNNKTPKSTRLVRMWWCTRTLLIIQCLTHTCSMNSSYCGYCYWTNFLAPILQNPVLYSQQSVGEMP